MQTRSEEKRRRICRAAAELFATRPYHEVLLSDVARAAGVGKGTIYVYFPSKDSLYLTIHMEELSDLLARLEGILAATADPVEAFSSVVRELVRHMFGSPQVLEVFRNVGVPAGHTPFREQFSLLVALLERAIRAGVEGGRFQDPRPDLTAVCVPGLVRSVLLHGPRSLDAEEASEHLLRLLLSALSAR